MNSILAEWEAKARHSSGQPYLTASQLGELTYCELQGWLTAQGVERSLQSQARMAVGSAKHQQLTDTADAVLNLQQKAGKNLRQAQGQLGAQAQQLADLVRKGDLIAAQQLAQQLSQGEVQRSIQFVLRELGGSTDSTLLQRLATALSSGDPRLQQQLQKELKQLADRQQQQLRTQQRLALGLGLLAMGLLLAYIFSASAQAAPLLAIAGIPDPLFGVGILLTCAGAVYFFWQAQQNQKYAQGNQRTAQIFDQALQDQQRTQSATRSAMTAGALVQEAQGKQTRELKLPAGAELLRADGSQTVPQEVISNHVYGLAGRPDKLIRYGNYLIPIEEKPKALRVYSSHRIQALAYCLLIEQHLETIPPYALVTTQEGAQEIAWNDRSRIELFKAIVRARTVLGNAKAPAPTAGAAQCKVCGVRKHCPTPVG